MSQQDFGDGRHEDRHEDRPQSNPFTLYPPKGNPIQLRFENDHLRVSPVQQDHTLMVVQNPDGSLRIQSLPPAV